MGNGKTSQYLRKLLHLIGTIAKIHKKILLKMQIIIKTVDSVSLQ
mgnify:CR=1 FL=1